MSLRLSTGRPRACSGLMYATVPTTRPSRVPSFVTVGDCDQSELLPSSGVRLGQAEIEDLHRYRPAVP